QLFERVGLLRYRNGEVEPFSVATTRLMAAPVMSVSRPGPEWRILPQALLRPEIYETVYSHQLDDIRAFAQLLRYWNHDETLLPSVESRGGKSSSRDKVVRVHGKPGKAPPPVDRRHPLVEELSKEGYNLMAEFEAAVANHSYKDACELIANLTPSEVQ